MSDRLKKTLEDIFPAPPADLDREALVPDAVPRHIAVIMDGNGRWAKSRGMDRGEGHKAGVNSLKEVVRASSDLGVEYVTVYAFSTENWKRPKLEVEGLMKLFIESMNSQIAELMDEGVRIRLLGRIDELPFATRTVLRQGEKRSADNTGLTLNIAVNYGSRAEITDAVAAIAQRIKEGDLAPEDVDEELISNNLYTADMPDPDLLIRTSGELRLSNYLLWQLAYSEFYITDALWPDFDRYELLRALLSYQDRDRRFGKVK